MIIVREIYDFLAKTYNIENSSNFDLGKVGLQFGSMNDKIDNVLICLDVTNEVIEEAIEKNVNLIISHHPFMFTPLVNMDYDSPFGQKIIKIIKNRINIMAYHTCFDVAKDGMNDILANKLGLDNIHHINFELNADSFIRLGNCESIKLIDLAKKVKEIFNLKGVKVAGNFDKIIKSVAIVGGSGGSEFYNALKSGADVFITGQLPHHLGFEAIENNFSLIEVSHGIEFMGIKELKKKLTEKFNNKINIIITNKKQDPYELI